MVTPSSRTQNWCVSTLYQHSPISGAAGSAASILIPEAAAATGNAPDKVSATPWPGLGVDETTGAPGSVGGAVRRVPGAMFATGEEVGLPRGFDPLVPASVWNPPVLVAAITSSVASTVQSGR